MEEGDLIFVIEAQRTNWEVRPMKAFQVGGVMALALGATVLGGMVEPPARAQGEMVWMPGFEQASTMARLQGKPIFLVFR
jgi:hypothetical protein